MPPWHGTARRAAPIARAGAGAHAARMRIVAVTNDPVRLSFLAALLRDAGIAAVVLDQHASAMDGSIGAVPRRLAVAEADERRARRVIAEAGLC